MDVKLSRSLCWLIASSLTSNIPNKCIQFVWIVMRKIFHLRLHVIGIQCAMIIVLCYKLCLHIPHRVHHFMDSESIECNQRIASTNLCSTLDYGSTIHHGTTSAARMNNFFIHRQKWTQDFLYCLKSKLLAGSGQLKLPQVDYTHVSANQQHWCPW